MTARELQVLRMFAGLTNRAIGSELGLSERTVDRHVTTSSAARGLLAHGGDGHGVRVRAPLTRPVPCLEPGSHG